MKENNLSFFVNTNTGDNMEKPPIDNKKLNQVLRICSKILKKIYVLVIILLIYLLILILGKLNIMLFLINVLNILSPLFIGMIIAWLLRPIVKYLTDKKMNKVFATITIYITILFLSYLLFSKIIPIFIHESNDFINVAPNLIDKIYNSINNIFSNIKIDLSALKNEIFNILAEFGTKTSRDIPITFVNTLKGLSSFLLGFLIGFYLLITDTTYINNTLNKYLKKDTYDLLLKINLILRNYVRATLFSSLLILIFSTIIFYLCGLKGALLFGFLCGVTNIIPFIGPYIGAVIPIILAFTKGISTGILVIVLILIIQIVEGNIIHPLIMSKSINIHPVTVIISLLIFGYFFGIIGMIVATPVVAITKEIYFYTMKKYESYKRKLVR